MAKRALTSRPSIVLGVALVVALGPACRKRAPEAPPATHATLPPVEVTKEGKWLFTYADPSGAFATVDDPQSVPEGSRRLVRVVDPAWGAAERRDGVNVYVVSLADVLRSGKAPAKVMSREAFETGALAQLPPGESSAWPPAVAQSAPGAASAEAADQASAAPAGVPVVTLYGTSWCGACKSARQYLSARKIPFADKDIEKDPAAARDLAAKAARLGVPADRVPILDVRGRLLIGFDKARLEAMLGEAS